MSKVTSKLQVTLPKVLADRYGIRPGDEIEWKAAGDAIRVEIPRFGQVMTVAERLALFDAATERQKRRQAGWRRKWKKADRGWTREDLYDARGLAR
jgi:bifunctional DNA-binding transcriptional regulator/antitoxin component of YhaV-PrlF toxin-antitoxin module